MKRLFFQLILSVMICACHDTNQQQKIDNEAIVESKNKDCLSDNAGNNLHQLDNIAIAAQGCPVK
ncbi:hypothetical protein A9G09_03840 [Gilliamella sp. wkB292]|uniref:hypothetical protein n=1 Tax=Gilliamella sp. wkB292 TaxID=3120262 RepID=UPI00080EBF55|nr:hypothetical protein [Gilliamella apicola]OCG16096.1 hypothetical protein A9G09_03840 [Gilliamella apicola]